MKPARFTELVIQCTKGPIYYENTKEGSLPHSLFTESERENARGVGEIARFIDGKDAELVERLLYFALNGGFQALHDAGMLAGDSGEDDLCRRIDKLLSGLNGV